MALFWIIISAIALGTASIGFFLARGMYRKPDPDAARTADGGGSGRPSLLTRSLRAAWLLAPFAINVGLIVFCRLRELPQNALWAVFFTIVIAHGILIGMFWNQAGFAANAAISVIILVEILITAGIFLFTVLDSTENGGILISKYGGLFFIVGAVVIALIIVAAAVIFDRRMAKK